MAECICDIDTGLLQPGVFNIKQFTNGTETMVWTVSSRYLGESNIDLDNYDAYIVLSVDGVIDEVLLTKANKGDTIELTWNIGEWATQLKGHVLYQIVFRSANFDKLGVISDDTNSKGVYSLANVNQSGDDRVFVGEKNSYNIKWDNENGRWTLYGADGSTVIDYQTTPDTEPHCGAWGEIAVGNLESAVWYSAEAIMYVSESIAADQSITANFPTILRQFWNKVIKTAGVVSVNGKNGIVELSANDVGAAEETHTHNINNITNLQQTLNGKANITHSHAINDVADLLTELNGKANKTHNHTIADTSGLQEALNGKSLVGHTHAITDVAGLSNKIANHDNHIEQIASDSKSGHVKIDGKTIQIDKNGVIKAVGGLSIGTIFPFASILPPEGAYLLNGQTITNCRELYPEFWEWVNNSGVRSIGNNTYEAELAETGICDGFVLWEQSGSVRLPTWKGYQTPLGNSVPVVGNGKTIGLTLDKNTVYPMWNYSGSQYRGLVLNTNSGSESLPNSTSNTGLTTQGAVGLSTDSSASGIIADTSGYATDSLYWCIQVFNAATGLSTQESAQLASQMQMKAQTDLANVTANIDFVVESWSDGNGNWYRKYRSGWIEQGGVVQRSGTASYNNYTLNFHKDFSNTNYTFLRNYAASGNDASNAAYSTGYASGTKTTTSIVVGTQNKGTAFDWYACGF